METLAQAETWPGLKYCYIHSKNAIDYTEYIFIPTLNRALLMRDNSTSQGHWAQCHFLRILSDVVLSHHDNVTKFCLLVTYQWRGQGGGNH